MDWEIYTQVTLFTSKQHCNIIHGQRLILILATISSAPGDISDVDPRDQKLFTEE